VNARTNPATLSPADSYPGAVDARTTTLMAPGYVFNEDLTFDLYGAVDEGQHTVESVLIAGTQHNVTTLLSREQLGNLACWLDLRNSDAPVLREWAGIHKQRAAKPDFKAA
jgi:hypothetical protein